MAHDLVGMTSSDGLAELVELDSSVMPDIYIKRFLERFGDAPGRWCGTPAHGKTDMRQSALTRDHRRFLNCAEKVQKIVHAAPIR